MKIAIISDIHSNKYALEAVLEDISANNINEVIILGDVFGYYPWASETYRLLLSKNNISAIKGNHDEIVLEAYANNLNKHLDYYLIARQNREDLLINEPSALEWLSHLKSSNTLTIDNHKITLCHGTPGNNLNGRYYPDNDMVYDWFPKHNEILLLGHTHYPLIRKIQNGGIIFNPGSVGQPRDGNIASSWGIWNLSNNLWELKRTVYDTKFAIEALIKLNWNKRAILALNKNYSGQLKS
ncbi:metallophosphoesterase family protein [Anabaena cylindrica FACHB-243]|uniref:Phosphoesterase n=1 Tax=Anabaena cylindrica (strain ATCC 27899 / PCC 7122) TaxID=272123 RepID=K9ZCP4_ANACC|nr:MULTISPECIES: metallophosphoesterase family protein [Anabaena]AFZ56951.1 metallophosphoesterase [Anabaena cylindrica PCC 7122]MBD2418861.1 metallophosphoesterase family protein [Anabaena cylindrica FACHB-243]MBY5285769.1 metallophosphoesterase family protein [Anabaena sp. CCAP 1446/1C]MBY5308752.1 metallophosphoesterase family protein [Anabaena sp. CCAP 1446/1C]MCM2405141.1 metallophosphatase family protein [Anabaena sp. CCAP 1446/1C]